MPIQSSIPLDLQDVYDYAVANGYSGANDLNSLLAWAEWGDLPSGADSLVDFLGVDVFQDILNNVDELNIPDYRAQAGNIRGLKLSNTEFLMLRGYVYNADKELGISYHTLLNNGQTIDTPSNNYLVLDSELFTSSSVDICHLSSGATVHTVILGNLTTNTNLRLRKIEFDSTTISFNTLVQQDITLPSSPWAPGYRIRLHNDGRLIVSGGFGLIFIDTNLTPGSIQQDISGDFSNASRVSSAFSDNLLFTSNSLLSGDGTYVKCYEIPSGQLAQFKNEQQILTVDTVYTETLYLKSNYFIVFYGVMVDPGKTEGYYKLFQYDDTLEVINAIGSTGIYYEVTSSPSNDTVQNTLATFYDELNEYIVLYSYTNYDSIYFQIFELDYQTGVLTELDTYALFPRSFPSSNFLKMINNSLVWAVRNNGGNSKYDDDSFLMGILEVTAPEKHNIRFNITNSSSQTITSFQFSGYYLVFGDNGHEVSGGVGFNLAPGAVFSALASTVGSTAETLNKLDFRIRVRQDSLSVSFQPTQNDSEPYVLSSNAITDSIPSPGRSGNTDYFEYQAIYQGALLTRTGQVGGFDITLDIIISDV